jgi:hypothetical protein
MKNTDHKGTQWKLFQNFSFWNSFLDLTGKTGPLTGFSKSLSKTNRVLDKLNGPDSPVFLCDFMF